MTDYYYCGHVRKLSRKQSRGSVRENGKDVNGIGLTTANRHAIGFLEHSKCIAQWST